jgi:hypothetical protein
MGPSRPRTESKRMDIVAIAIALAAFALLYVLIAGLDRV